MSWWVWSAGLVDPRKQGGDEDEGCWSAIASLTGGAEGMMTALSDTRFYAALSWAL